MLKTPPETPKPDGYFARQVCSPCHAVTAEQASQRVISIGPDFQTIAGDDDRSSRLSADVASEDADLILTRAQSDDVIAFLPSPRDRRNQKP
jgi:hypothetical protein